MTEYKNEMKANIYRMSKASLKRYNFSFFLKSVVSETVRKSTGREFHDIGPEKDKPYSPNLVCSLGVEHPALGSITFPLGFKW